MRLRAIFFGLFTLVTAAFFAGCISSPGDYPITVDHLTPYELTAGSSDFHLRVSGYNFHSDSKVLFGDQTLTPSLSTSTQLQVTVPASAVASAGIVNVVVTGSRTSSARPFTVKNPLPTVSILSQSEVALNSTAISLGIVGSNFVSTSTVKLGDSILKPSAFTSTHLTVAVPDALLTTAQVLNLSVVNPGPGGGTSSAKNFTVLNPLPSITALSVEEAALNSADLPLIITGKDFAPGMKVNFGSMLLDPLEVTPTKATVIVPLAAFTKSAIDNVTAVNGGPGGGTSNTLQFVVKNPKPSLTSLSVAKVLVGSDDLTLNLTGTGFIPDESKVHFGSLTLTPASATFDQLSVVVPKAALAQSGTVPVDVMTGEPGGGYSNVLQFTVENPTPTLTSLSRNDVTGGSGAFDLTLKGTNFALDAVVNFGGAQLTPTAVSGSQITVAIPVASMLDAGEYQVMVSNPEPGGGSSNALLFTINNPVPILNALSKGTVIRLSSNTILTLTGSGFVHQSRVLFGAATLVPSASTAGQITVTIPATVLSKVGPVDVSVTNPGPGGGTSNALGIFVHERAEIDFDTVVDNKAPFSDGSSMLFNSYNQPSVSNSGMVVFKGQSKGNSGPVVGIYVRDMSCNRGNGGRSSCPRDLSGFNSLRQITAKGIVVPQPNNTQYNNAYAGFMQFPSFPRIDIDTNNVAFRGQSQPTWTFTLNGAETRIGSAGIFTKTDNSDLKTSVGLLGTVPGFEYFIVPSLIATRFDQFPGSPAIYHNYVVFKGNYTIGNLGKTGVYYRDVVPNTSGQSPFEHPVFKIADSETEIPGQTNGSKVLFGSTAPPSAADGKVVFLGLDNEDAPTMGAIYMATLPPPDAGQKPADGLPLTTLVAIGEQVPGEAVGVTFNRLSEGLSFDGRYVGFWGSWGTETRIRTLVCGVDGNKDMLADCLQRFPDGHEVQVPVYQGIFVYDIQDNTLHAIAKTRTTDTTGTTGIANQGFTDFIYWVFSGRPPNVGDSSGTGSSGTGGTDSDSSGGDSGGDTGPGEDVVPEPPRWRSSAFVAVEGLGPNHDPNDPDQFKAAFKAQATGSDGVYLAHSSDLTRIQTVIDTSTAGNDIDPVYAPADSVISTVGLERDGLRNDQLVITASMLNSVTAESNAGVYITTLKPLSPPPSPEPLP